LVRRPRPRAIRLTDVVIPTPPVSGIGAVGLHYQGATR
jgi:hypothetical protein